jgi:hypothetical protein
MPPLITFLPNGGKPEKSHGTQIFEEGVERRRSRDEKAQGWHIEERPLGQEGQEPQTGDCDRTVGGEGERQEGAEEGLEEAEGFEEKDGEEVEAEGEEVRLCHSGARVARARNPFQYRLCSRMDSGPAPKGRIPE